MFGQAVKQAKASKKVQGGGTFVLEELAWFSRNSYNLGIKNCSVWEPEVVLKLIQACLGVITYG